MGKKVEIDFDESSRAQRENKNQGLNKPSTYKPQPPKGKDTSPVKGKGGTTTTSSSSSRRIDELSPEIVNEKVLGGLELLSLFSKGRSKPFENKDNNSNPPRTRSPNLQRVKRSPSKSPPKNHIQSLILSFLADTS